MQPSEEIKEKINIVDLVGETVRLRKAGVNWLGLCPFHQEKTPSFTVSAVKQMWYCFGCNLGGDVFEFVKQSEGVEFREALEILAARAGIELKRFEGPSYAPDQKKNLFEINRWAALYYAKVLAESKSAQPARAYLQKRGLKPETINKWQIGYAPEGFHAFEEFIVKKGYTKSETSVAGLLVKRDETLRFAQGDNVSYFDRFHGRVMFPLYDIHGRVAGFTGRVLDGSPSTSSGTITSKYINSPETAIYSKSRLIYGLNFAKSGIRKQDQVIVVEGNIDVITCHEHGFENVVGSSGTAFTKDQLENLKRFTENILFALDADAAGLAATRRAVELALGAGFNVKIVSIPKTLAKDPDELIRKDANLWKDRVKGAQNFLDFYFSRIFATMDLQSNIGKKQAVREIIPLLSLLPDSIDRVHYAQKLAGAVGVPEKVIIDLVNKSVVPMKSGSGDEPRTAPAERRRNKQEILEARVLALFLKFPEELKGETGKFRIEDFSSPAYREIFRAVAEGSTPAGHLQADFQLLVFALESEIAQMPGGNMEWFKKNFIGPFHLAVLRRHMLDLSSRIKQAEAAGNLETVKILSLQFNQLAVEFGKLHQS